MKRLILAGVLAVAAVLGSESQAQALGWGRDGISIAFGFRLSYWYDHGPSYHSHHSACYGPGCYGAAPFVGDHAWAHSGPFYTPDTFAGYAYNGGYPVSTGAAAGQQAPAGTMVGHSYGQGYGYGQGHGYGYDYGNGYGYAY